MKNAPAQTTNEGALDKRNFKPTYPEFNTQPARLLVALLQRAKVNPLDGWRKLGIYRLSDTAFKLRGMGWPVVTGSLDVKNRFGEQCHVAEYFLPDEAIAAAGERGQKYAHECARIEAERRAA